MLAAIIAGSSISFGGCSDLDDTATSTPRPKDAPTGTETLTVNANRSTTVAQRSTPISTRIPSDVLVTENRETETSMVEVYERIVWEATGRLVIEDGAGIKLKEVE